MNPATGRKGDVTGETPREGNKYNHNYAGRFCACADVYDPAKEKGTMFQCLGLGTVESGGCGEDWWHPECLLGLPRTTSHVTNGDELTDTKRGQDGAAHEAVPTDTTTAEIGEHPAADNEPPLPTGFPAEDDFDHLICYKCVESNPWIKQYAGTTGFLPAVPFGTTNPKEQAEVESLGQKVDASAGAKRKLEEDGDTAEPAKRLKSESEESAPANGQQTDAQDAAKHTRLPPAPVGRFSLFLIEDFRDHFCRCPSCFPQLAKHPQLLEEEDTYEPPMSESDPGEDGDGSVGSRSLMERGEAALSTVDRVRAIEGVMAYNHLKDKVKTFLQPFAESGQAVGAEDVKAYFAKLRGDEEASRLAAAGGGSTEDGGGEDDDKRREQSGY